MKPLPLLPLIATLSLLLPSCASRSASRLGAEVEPGPVLVEKGMPAADLLAALGEPEDIASPDAANDKVEVWRYRQARFTVEDRTAEAMEQAGLTSAGIMGAPLRMTQRSEVITEFLIVEGVVVSWKQRVEGPPKGRI